MVGSEAVAPGERPNGNTDCCCCQVSWQQQPSEHSSLCEPAGPVVAGRLLEDDVQPAHTSPVTPPAAGASSGDVRLPLPPSGAAGSPPWEARQLLPKAAELRFGQAL
ncbi:hypothetical protein GCM10010359_23180 [Streptomyces morookaense]|nr:hypothetical protein GCM10010359_23180 [Streptomyces morookaense]